jgi:hypothetical protein
VTTTSLAIRIRDRVRAPREAGEEGDRDDVDVGFDRHGTYLLVHDVHDLVFGRCDRREMDAGDRWDEIEAVTVSITRGVTDDDADLHAEKRGHD